MLDVPVIEDLAAAEVSLDPVWARLPAEPVSAASYVISPAAFAAVRPEPARSPDRLSVRRLLAVAARLVRDVGPLITGAAKRAPRADETTA